MQIPTKKPKILTDPETNPAHTITIAAILVGYKKTRSQVEIINIGSEDQTTVKTIAEIVAKEMKLKNVQYEFAGGVEGGRGWTGDVKNMLLDNSGIRALGWKPEINTRQAVRKAAKQAIHLNHLFNPPE